MQSKIYLPLDYNLENRKKKSVIPLKKLKNLKYIFNNITTPSCPFPRCHVFCQNMCFLILSKTYFYTIFFLIKCKFSQKVQMFRHNN